MVVTGIIRPPLDIRAVADKTALFVSKNGRAFENRILNSEKGQTPKFAFLHDNSPFHAYYEDKIRFYQQGGTDEKKDKKEEEQQEEKKEEQLKLAVIRKPAQQAEKKSAHDPIAKALLRQRNNIRSQYEQAEKDRKESKGDDNNKDQQPTRVVITPPPPLHYVGITAPTNLTAAQVETIKLVAQFITLDESKNFLQNLTIREWNNPTFAFLQPRHAHFAYFSALADCYKYIVQAALKKGFKAKSSLQEYLDLAAYRAEYQLDAAERKQGDAEDDEANAIDWHDFVLVETIEFAKDERVQPLVMPLEVDEMQESDDDEDGETIRVVPNYTPKVVASGQTSISQTHVIDPITGKSVPAAQTSEHMRIQLLDPKWAEEKKKFQEKQKESNLVAGDAIATNLSRVVGDVSGRYSELRADPRKRLEEANRVVREQAQQPGPMREPAAKRLRMDGGPPLPPPPPPPPGHFSLPPMPPPGMPPVQGLPPGMPPGMPPPPPHYGMHGHGMPPMPPPGGMPPMPPGMPPKPFASMGVGPPPPPPEELAIVELLPEDEFAASLESPMVTLEIAIPHDPSSPEWNFNGQTVSLSVNVMSKIKAVKEELSGAALNKININKLQLKHSQQSFLKDSMTLAHFNLGPLVSLEVVPKTRGRTTRK